LPISAAADDTDYADCQLLLPPSRMLMNSFYFATRFVLLMREARCAARKIQRCCILASERFAAAMR